MAGDGIKVGGAGIDTLVNEMKSGLAKLEQRGVITGYGPEVEPEAMGYPILALMLLDLAQGRLEEAVAALDGVPEVLEADAVSGPHDIIARVDAVTLADVQTLARTLFRQPEALVVVGPEQPPPVL